MNYQKIYNQIIKRGKKEQIKRINSRQDGSYFETHHIIPVCLGGTGKLSEWKTHSNLVQLTAREHFLCHRLLIRIYPSNKKLAGAFWRMCTQKSGIQERYIPNSKEYEEARISWSLIPVSQETRNKLSKCNKGKTVSEETRQRLRNTNLGKTQSEESNRKRSKKLKGKEPWNKGILYTEEQCKLMSKKDTLLGKKRKPFTDKTRKKMSDSKLGQIPWNKGIQRPKLICPHCNKEGGDGNMQRWHFDNCKLKQQKN